MSAFDEALEAAIQAEREEYSRRRLIPAGGWEQDFRKRAARILAAAQPLLVAEVEKERVRELEAILERLLGEEAVEAASDEIGCRAHPMGDETTETVARAAITAALNEATNHHEEEKP